MHSLSRLIRLLSPFTWLLFGSWSVLFILFYSLNSGITCTNDGGHFGSINSLIQRGSFVLEENSRFAAHDSAYYKGRTYAGREPGVALLGFGFHAVFAFLKPIQRVLFMDPYTDGMVSDGERRAITLVMVLSALFGATLFVVLYHFLRVFSVGRGIASLVSLVFLLSTILLRYSTVLYAHIFSVTLVCGAFLQLFRWVREPESTVRLLLASLLLAYAVITEPITIILYAPMVGFMAYGNIRRLFNKKALTAFLLGGLVPFVTITTFNYLNFDHPIYGAYFHLPAFPFMQSTSTMFRLNHTFTWVQRLTFGSYPFTSIFMASPVLLFAIPGFVLLIVGKTKTRSEYTVSAVCFFLALFAIASFKTPWGGYDLDYRYMIFVLPFLAPFVATVFVWLREEKGTYAKHVRGFGIGLFVLLAILSSQTQFAHIRHGGQPPFSTYFVNVAPSLINTLPFILLVLAGLLVVKHWQVKG